MISSVLEAIPLPSVFIGPDARIMGGNKLAVGLQPGASETRAFVLVFRQPGFSRAFEECMRTKTPQHTSYTHVDGVQETRFDVTCSYVSYGELTGVLACFRDVSEVEQASEIRRDFVANVSHELKTPLTAVLGFIETLQGPAKGDQDAHDRFLSIMGEEASRMNRLVGDLLSLSRVEEEARMRPTDNVHVGDIVETVVRNLSEVARARGTEVQILGLDDGFDTVVPGDADQLVQVFTNLIENAIKYGKEQGQVTIEFLDVGRDAFLRQDAIRIEVSDEGAGIDPLDIPRLTERFYRIDSHRSRAMGGTGLGLAIVKHIVNRHRGRLKIDSTLGEGSRFSVVLPRK